MLWNGRYRTSNFAKLRFRSEGSRKPSWPLLRPVEADAGLGKRLRLSCDVDVGVHVRRSAEVPDEGRPLQTPDVPLFVMTQVPSLVEGHVQPIETASGLRTARASSTCSSRYGARMTLLTSSTRSFWSSERSPTAMPGKLPDGPWTATSCSGGALPNNAFLRCLPSRAANTSLALTV